MRIAHISDCYFPRTGGIETQVSSLALRQQARGDQVRVITATPGHGQVRAGSDVVDGLDVLRIAARMPFELPVHPRTRSSVRAALEAGPADVVHVHVGSVSPFAWGATLAAVDCGLPVLVTVHSMWGPLARPGYGLAERLAHWGSRGIQLSAVSRTAAREVARAVPQAQSVIVVPNGIDQLDWRLADWHEGDPGELRLVTVMRMAPRKRVGALVRSAAMAQRALGAQGRLRLTLIGDGPERSRAEKWVAAHGLADQFRFAGRLDREGILDAFSRADAYAQPSVRESFGIAALEARTAGLPVLVRKESGSVQFVQDGVTGLVVADDAGLAAAMVRLAREPGLAARMREHNMACPPHEQWSNVLVDVDKAYAAARDRAAAS